MLVDQYNLCYKVVQKYYIEDNKAMNIIIVLGLMDAEMWKDHLIISVFLCDEIP